MAITDEYNPCRGDIPEIIPMCLVLHNVIESDSDPIILDRRCHGQAATDACMHTVF